jgi:Fibronectin type III domain.
MAAHRIFRRRPRLTGWLLAVGAVVGVLTLFAGAAGAYWSSHGAGSGSATTGTLAAPTNIQVPATSTGSVQVTWTASTGTPAPTGYYVTRNPGGTVVAGCGTPTAPINATSCTDSGVPGGTYTYTVTAVYHSWTAVSSASSSVQVASKIVFTSQPTGASAGAAFSASVTLQDPSGNTVAFSGQPVNVVLGTNPGSGTLSGTLTATTNASGVATLSNLSINKSGTGYTLTATSTGLTGATSNPFNITAGTATKLAFTTPPSGSTGGVPFGTQPAVTVQDANGNTVTGNSSQVTLALTTPNGATLSCASNPQSASSGVATFSGCAINKAGTYTLTATDGTLTSAVSSSITISVGPASLFTVTPTTTTPTAGTGFTVTLTATDAGGNTVNSYTGPHTITWNAPSSPSGKAPSYPASSVTFSNGGSTGTLSATLYAAGANTLTAKEGTTVTGSAALALRAGAAASVAWANLTSSAGTVSSVCALTCTVSALENNGSVTAYVAITDQYGNIVNNIGAAASVTITLTSGGSGAFTSPSSGSSVSLTIPASGQAVSAATFTFVTGKGNYTDVLTGSTPSYSGTASVTLNHN